MAGPAGRIAALDVARGTAIVAMVLYHAAWDAGFVRLTPENYALTGPGRDAARLIAGAFLGLVGIGLAAAHGEGLRRRPFLRRLALVAGAALAITAATVVAFPESYIFFGILHAVAATSVLALPFLRAPVAVTLLAAVAAFAAPLLLRQPVFDAPVLAFLGLGTRVPVANDYVPLFPWLGAVLAGVATARAGRIGERRTGPPRSRPARALAWLGRHSLVVYLIHQPVLLGAAHGLVALTGPHREAGSASFLRAYEASCARTGGRPAPCALAAHCAMDRLGTDGLWTRRDAYTEDERARATALSRDCFAKAMAAP